MQRPLQLRFEVTDETLDALREQKAFANLAVSKKKDDKVREAEEAAGRVEQQAIIGALSTLGDAPFMDREPFREAMEAAFKAAALKVKAPVKKAIEAALSSRDEEAAICRDNQGNPEPDSQLADTEIVPLKQDIRDYFEREVLPHVPDAWIDESYRDHKDKQIGRVGYEIPFNRHFYVFKPPRPLAEIDNDLKVVTDRILAMIGGMAQ